MLASQLMTTPAVTIGPSASLHEAIRLLDRCRITALPVVDGDEHLVGIVCAADVLPRRVIDDPPAPTRSRETWPDLSAHSVADVMTVFVVSVDKSADATGVARLMLETGVKSVPVLDDGRVVGMLTRRDLLGALVTTDDHIANEVNVLLSQAGLDFQASVNHGEVDLVGWGSERACRIAAIVAGAVRGVTAVHLRYEGRKVPSQDRSGGFTVIEGHAIETASIRDNGADSQLTKGR
jgi:CBS domain-containing protein